MLTKNDTVEAPEVAEPEIKRAKAVSEADPKSEHGVFRRAAVFLFRFSLQIVLMIAVLAGSYMGMQRLLNSAPEKPKRPVFKSVYTVDTVAVSRAVFQPTLIVYGETVSSRNVELRSLVAGEITSVSDKLKTGALVEKGDALVEIDRFAYEGALREAKANEAETVARISEYQAGLATEESRLKNAREQMQLAQTDYDRIVALRKRGTANQKQVDERALVLSQRRQAVEQSEITLVAQNAKLEQQRAILERLKWRVQQAERNLKDTVLIAPFDGVISASQAETGRLVSANDVVVSMYEADKLDVKFTLTDQRFGRLQSDDEGVIGREVQVRWVIGGEVFSFPAVIERIGAEIMSSRGGVEVFATLMETGRANIRPGAFVEVLVPDRKYDNHFQLPETSIYDGNTAYAIVEGKLEARPVTIVGFEGEKTIVLAGQEGGLQDGDEVLVTRIAEVGNGLLVRREGDPVPARGQGSGQQRPGAKSDENAAGKSDTKQAAKKPAKADEGASK